ncbi:3-carboxy-cis,cis-muconate cycloisomerase [Deinococcus aquiradiocola]|uniref:3-carboxy-cis,cis-muconate cycloisomerase n=1 Tax=Deinococcus aquiradiocola TaxID=393059 RepID=A0A917UMQ2_9DEIO|nr:3-carboxy-cis,cis-muconate cycloisomerase [Deinococcus aquiradiocola]GGJ68513.1 3-carboxy-cis,cis-muconate cycloisomerase [Deinococcus aquiradiocola]
MSFSPLDSALYGPMFTTPDMTALFRDDAQLARMLQVEVALARVQARLGLIAEQAAEQIAASALTFSVDLQRLQPGLLRDGVPVPALLGEWRAQLPEPARTALHRGATTQDIVDTALVLTLRDAHALLDAELHALMTVMAALAQRHRHTVMAGRTHSQQAVPVTFGLKVAGWLAPLVRHAGRLHELRPRLLVLQFGGAAGTLSALNGDGLRVASALAGELALAEALMPWHTQRDALAELAGWLSLVTGGLGKVGQDLLLLAQSEVAEVTEGARGGSSTMPQKSNPVQSELLVAAARMNATLLPALHHALVQEHERGTHGWQLEWLTLPQMLGLTAGALTRARHLLEDLNVNTAHMQATLDASRGLMLAEAYTFALTPLIGRADAARRVQEAVQAVLHRQAPTLQDALGGQDGIPASLPRLNEVDVLGASGELIDRVTAALDALQRQAG